MKNAFFYFKFNFKSLYLFIIFIELRKYENALNKSLSVEIFSLKFLSLNIITLSLLQDGDNHAKMSIS